MVLLSIRVPLSFAHFHLSPSLFHVADEHRVQTGEAMPIQAKGRFPKPSTTFRDDGREAREAGRGAGIATKPVIEEYRALKDMPRGDEALKLLQSVGLTVKPIMIKHRWSA